VKPTAAALAHERGLTFVHPYDDPDIAAGQGTVGLEMLQDQPDLDMLVVATGGGGLIAGVAMAAQALRPSIEIVGVQVERFPAMVHAMTGYRHPQGQTTIAEGIAVGTPGELPQAIVRERVRDWLLVDEGDIEQAIVVLL
jgi:threonine dehydratase